MLFRSDFVNDKLIVEIITIINYEMTREEKVFVYHTQGYIRNTIKESEVNRLVTHEYYEGGIFNGTKN